MSHAPEDPSSTRREFLKTSLVTAAAASVAGTHLQASGKSEGALPVVGSGDYVYECIHNWDRAGLPAGHEYGNASHGVAVDRQGLIYITHHGGPGSLFVFDQNGKFVKAMGDQHRDTQLGGMGHGIDIRVEGGEEFIYLSPDNGSMAFTKMTLGGEVVWTRDRASLSRDSGGLLDDPAASFRPTNTSFRPDGGYYLGDGYGSNYLFEYDRNDRFVRTLGGKGTEDGKFNTPHGQWLDERDGTPRLVVADRANKRLQWFDMNGNHAKTLDGFLFPADIDVQGPLMLVPDLHARVTILNENNEVVAQLGDDPQWREQVLADKFAMRARPADWLPGKFVHPHDACFDADGNIFVVEWVKTGRVTKLVRRV